jgi:thiol:disulfide interchange protein
MNMFLSRMVLLTLCLAWASGSLAAAQNTTARLLLEHASVRAGDSTRIGVRLQMNEGWHTYWVNSGESGGPTEIEWELPEGVTVGEIQWPVPELYMFAGFGTYVYHDEVLLMAPLHVAGSVREGTHELKAKVDWLECKEVCLPAGATVSARLEVGTSMVASDDAGAFARWDANLPGRDPPPGLRAGWEGPGVGNNRWFWIEWERRDGEVTPDFYALPADGYEVTPRSERLDAEEGRVRIRSQLTRFTEAWPERVAGLLVERLEPELAVTEVILALDAEGSPEEAAEERAAVGPSVWLMLWFAFVGGLILNLMPCVLPVIALKVLGFLNQVKQSPAEVRAHGLIYGGGVLVSFLALAALVLVVQAGGRLAGWGMQFQSPGFLLIMTTLVALVALNLFGVFEVTLGGRAMGAAAQLASKSGPSGSFFHGMLATALATPCTAPFLGAALGFAMLQPAPVVVLMFLMVGLGLASPYVLVSFVPGLARWLPRPGPWMERFKVAMGFPMAATAFWLLSVLAQHYGTEGVLWIGVYLVCLALALWVWGEFVQQGTRRKPIAVAISVALLVAGYGIALEQQLKWRAPVAAAGSGVPRQVAGGIEWERWSREAVAEALEAGRPVMVDFTAAWCVTCLANKKTSIEIASVREKLREIGAVTLMGDYTLRDDEITEELRRWGRAGVPLVLVYSRDATAPPRVLPELLTPGIVMDALEWAAKG